VSFAAIDAQHNRSGLQTDVIEGPIFMIPSEEDLSRIITGMTLTVITHPHQIREMEIDDLSAVFELGDSIYSADLYPNLSRIWSEAEVVEMFGTDRYCPSPLVRHSVSMRH
jgi:hypothetical protein